VNIHSISVSLIISPFTIINITINVIESASPMGNVVLPVTFIFSTIRPYLDAIPVPDQPFALTLIDSSIIKHQLIFILEARFI